MSLALNANELRLNQDPSPPCSVLFILYQWGIKIIGDATFQFYTVFLLKQKNENMDSAIWRMIREVSYFPQIVGSSIHLYHEKGNDSKLE